MFLNVIFWCVLFLNSLITTKPQIDQQNYRAALYSMNLDFTKIHQIWPEIETNLPDLSTVSYKYFIQHGNDTFIEIIDPGNEIKAFTGCIKKLDYLKGESTFTCYNDYSRTYYTTTDTISYSIEERKGTILNPCKKMELNTNCDSVSFFLHSKKANYSLIINDKVANLRFDKLFYPDIEYLPSKIIEISPGKNIMILEDVFYGKSSVDSILQLYDYKGYQQITEADINPVDIQIANDMIEKLKKIKY